MKSDIEIAQSVKMRRIDEVAREAGISEKYIEHYGKYKAKIDLSLLKELPAKNGKLILVTAITPTPAGEGKTTTSIGFGRWPPAHRQKCSSGPSGTFIGAGFRY